MPKIDFSQAPHYDDLDERKKFYRILFNPINAAVQTRELNQIQSLFALQMSRLSKHFFKEGAMVVPGNVSYDLEYAFVKCVSNSNLDQEAYRNTNFLNKVLVGTSGIKALVVNHLGPNIDGDVTFFVRYTKSSTNGLVGTFAPDEVLTVESTAITATVAPVGRTPIGLGSAAFIDEGIYHVAGMMMLVERQSIILDPYGNAPSVRVGLQLTESIITPNDDATLYSNAQGTYNYAAPGANRYKAELILKAVPLGDIGGEESEDFYELLRIEDGVLQKIVEVTEYSELEKTFARRTYDESGNYVVNPFFARAIDHPSDSSKIRVEIDPGKAYVRGYEITKVAKSYVDIDRSTDFNRTNNSSVSTPIGSYVLVTTVRGDSPDLLNFSTVNLQSKIDSTTGNDVIGTARVRAIVHHSGTPGDTATYRLYLFDIKITAAGKTFSDVAKISNSTFSCIPERQHIFVTGQTLTVSTNAATGVSTFWLNDPDNLRRVKAGDYLFFDGDYHRVASVSTNSALVFDAASDGTYSFAYTYTELFDPNTTQLVFPLPHNFIRRVKTDDDTTSDVIYNVKRVFSATVSSNAITISTGNTDEEFLPRTSETYQIIRTSGSPLQTLDHTAFTFGSLPASSVQISNMGLADGTTVKVVATVRKKSGSPVSPKLKSLQVNQVVNSAANAQNLDVVSLGKADIYALKKVYMKVGDFANAPVDSNDGQDITDWYSLDDGQRDSFYDLGRIIKRPGTPPITGRLRIEFDYFTHSGSSSYFSVDSYTGVVDYNDIPKFKGEGFIYDLRDCLDFRPRINDAGTAFDNSTGHLTEMPIDEFVSADYSYYLNRIDKIYLSYTGDFNVVKGVPGLLPVRPQDPSDDGMVTHVLNVQAFTLNPQSVFIDYVENKRFTMSDIGKLEKRIDNLEYYTALTLLEKETQDFQIRDQNGIDRLKSGFLVDSFKGHGIGDVLNPDYSCSVDFQNGELRPMFTEKNVSLVFDQITSDNFTKTGDLITLPYTHSILVDQPLASNAMNVNPFNVMSFFGLLTLNPPQDEWKDTEKAPDLIINQDGDFDTMNTIAESMGTIWNEWQVMGTGVVDVRVDTKKTKEVAPQPMLHRMRDGSTDTTTRWSGQMSRPGVDPWPWRINQTIRTTTTIETNEQRVGQRAVVVPKTVNQNIGESVISVAYIPFIRNRLVSFAAKGLKPNTRVYPFFDGTNVTSNVRPIGGNFGDALVSDAAGELSGEFNIPAGQFRTGQRVFRLTSNSVNDPEDWTTQANAVYTAQGLLETKQSTILSTRTPQIVWEEVRDDRIITNRNVETQFVEGKWRDPLAQTFLVTKQGGCFLSKVQLFFRKKDANIPVQVEIREVVNGYPGQRVLPFSQVLLNPSSVHTNEIVNGELVVDGGAPISSFDSSDLVATEFVFPSLVYCKEGEEYAVVVMANSNNYETWIATFAMNPVTQLPYTLVGTNRPVEGQPYAGSLFKSQNSSTWTAAQESDLMFKLFCAEFDTGVIGDLYFNNAAIPSRVLGANPIQTANQKKKIRVYHPYHGMSVGSRVQLSGCANTNGLPAGRLNATHTIASCDLESYVIDLASVTIASASSSGTTLTGTGFNTKLVAGSVVYHAGQNQYRRVVTVTNDTTAVIDSAFSPDLSTETVEVFAGTTGVAGGSNVVATEDIQVDTMLPVVGNLEFPDTASSYYIKTTSGRSPDGSQTAYVYDSNYSQVIVNDNIDFASPRLIASSVNETQHLSGEKSFELRAMLASGNKNLSPVIDLARLSLITIGNRIDNPTFANRNDADLDNRTLVTASNIGFEIGANGTDGKIVSTNATTSGLLGVITKGKYITVSGAGNGANNGTFLVKSVTVSGSNSTIVVDSIMANEAASASVTVVLHDRFVHESAQGASSRFKYMTRRMFLSETSNSLKILLAANLPLGSDLEVWYRVSKIDEQTPFDELSYRRANPDFPLRNTGGPTEFLDTAYTVELPNEDFSGVTVKLVGKSISTTNVPRVRGLRVIALAT